jgi:hypothetical protein
MPAAHCNQQPNDNIAWCSRLIVVFINLFQHFQKRKILGQLNMI